MQSGFKMYLEKAKTNNTKPLNKDDEINALEQILKDENLTITFSNGILNPLVYFELLPLTMIASGEEHAYLSTTNQINNARLHAAKLAILFENTKDAIDYLYRYEKSTMESTSPTIHDACLFTLPTDEKWPSDAWKIVRAIILKQMPISPRDLILRLLPFSFKMHEYVQKNQEKLKEKILAQVTREEEKKITQQYDEDIATLQKGLNEYIWRYLQEHEDEITKEINHLFGLYLRIQLNLSPSKLNKEEAKRLGDRIAAKLPADREEYYRIKQKFRDKIINKARMEYKETTAFAAKKLSKEIYIKKKLKNRTKQIHAIVTEKTNNLFSADTPVLELFSYSQQFTYERAHENLNAAVIFFGQHKTEALFNEYLSLQPQDDPALIPPVFIDGKDINPKYKNFYLTKLSPSDPRLAIIGDYTGCCQSLGAQGRESAIHSIINPAGGCYVLQKRLRDTPQASDLILAQCWAWRSSYGAIVLDSIESQLDFRSKATDIIVAFYTTLARTLVSHHRVPRVHVGLGGHTPQEMKRVQAIKHEILDQSIYTDAHEQAMIADQRFPLLTVIYNNQFNSTILPSLDIDLTIQHVQNWVDFFILSPFSNENLLYLVRPYYEKLKINDEYIQNRIQFTRNWITHLNKGLPSISDIKTFKNAGGNLWVYNEHSHTPLSLAIKAHEIPTTRWLVENGADPSTDNIRNEDLLILIANSNSCSLSDYIWFLEHGLMTHNTSEIFRITWNKWKLAGVQPLIERGMNANTPVEDTTLLQLAVTDNNFPAAIWLIEHGAKVTGSILKIMWDKWKTEIQPLVGRINIDMIIPNEDDHLHNVLESINNESSTPQSELVPITDGYTLLQLASMAGDMPGAMWLVEHGADINLNNPRNPLFLMARADGTTVNDVLWFMDHGATATNDDMGGILLFMKYKWGLESLLPLIERGIDINTYPFLPDAVRENKINEVVWLVEHGCNLNQKRNQWDRTSLHIAIDDNYLEIAFYLLKQRVSLEGIVLIDLINKEKEILEACVRAGADPSAKNSDGNTILHRLHVISPEITRLLLNHASDLDVKDNNGDTSLFNDLLNLKTMRMLIHAGADVNARNNVGETPLHKLSNIPMANLKFLLTHGADVNAISDNGTPVLAMYCWNYDKFRLLIERGANYQNLKTNGGPSLLHHAAVGSTEVLNWLIQQGLDVNAVNETRPTILRWEQYLHGMRVDSGYTSLKGKQPVILWAIESLNWENVRILAENGADLNMKLDTQKTVLDVIKSKRFVDPKLLAYLESVAATPKSQNRISFSLFAKNIQQPSATEQKIDTTLKKSSQMGSDPK